MYIHKIFVAFLATFRMDLAPHRKASSAAVYWYHSRCRWGYSSDGTDARLQATASRTWSSTSATWRVHRCPHHQSGQGARSPAGRGKSSATKQRLAQLRSERTGQSNTARRKCSIPTFRSLKRHCHGQTTSAVLHESRFLSGV